MAGCEALLCNSKTSQCRSWFRAKHASTGAMSIFDHTLINALGDSEAREALRHMGLTNPTRIRRVHEGYNSAIWRVEHAGQWYALRILKPEQEEQRQREVAAMQAAASVVSVPHVHASDNWRDHPALLLSWLPGRPLKHELRVRPWRAWRLGVSFGKTQAAINALPAPMLLRQSGCLWTQRGPREKAVLARLHASGARMDALLHFDYHPNNVTTDGTRITGVFDWGGAVAGDPRGDAALTVCMLRFDQVKPGRLLVPGHTVLRVFEQGWRYGYGQAATQRDSMAPFYAWAGTVIEQDVASRQGPEELARLRAWTTSWMAYEAP